MKSLNNPEIPAVKIAGTPTEKIFVIFTDVIGSCDIDSASNGDFITWRTKNFSNQLEEFLKCPTREIIKSVGDALFIKSTFPNTPSKDDIENLLSTLVQIFQKCSLVNTPIRITIHVLEAKFGYGETLAKKLNKKELRSLENHSFSKFIKGLKPDLFGTEINKAARIQGLAKEATILVTQDVVKLLDPELAKLTYEFSNCVLYNPVPVTYLKGIFEFKGKIDEKRNSYYIRVWELSNIDKKSYILAKESKQYHTIRLLNADINFTPPITNDLASRTRAMNEINSDVYKKVFEKVKETGQEVLNYHTDVIFEIQNIYEFRKIDFTRPGHNNSEPKPSSNFNKFLGEKDLESEIKPIESLFTILNFSHTVDGNIICTVEDKKYFPNEIKSHIPFMVVCSFPNQEIASKLRVLYEYNSGKSGEDSPVQIIEPQTIQIFQHIGIESAEIVRTPEDLYIFMFFGVYNDYIDGADNPEILFRSAQSINTPRVFAKGILTYLVDGFIIYKSTDTNFCSDFSKILNSLFKKSSGRQSNVSFYDRVFPISVFTLKLKKFEEENVKTLMKLRKM